MFLSLYNISLALSKQGGISVRKIKCMPFFVLSPFCVAIGLYGLYVLTNTPTGYRILYGILGVFTIFAAISLRMSPTLLPRRTRISGFYITAFFTGVLTGLFTAGVAPMIYLLYRQPWCLSMIRYVLFISSMILIPSRMIFVFVYEGFTWDILIWSALSLPCVYIATKLARKYIRRTNTCFLRNIAFVMLLLSGVNIVVKTVLM